MSSSEEKKADRSSEGASTPLLGLFIPPPHQSRSPSNNTNNDNIGDQRVNSVSSCERTPLLRDSSLQKLFEQQQPVAAAAPPLPPPPPLPSCDKKTPKIGTTKKCIPVVAPMEPASATHKRVESNLPSISEIPLNDADERPSKPIIPRLDMRFVLQKVASIGRSSLSEATKATTWVGGFMALLFHSVFCLTIGSAIIRPHGLVPMLGLMTKMAAIGIISAASVFWVGLSDDVPAIYPTVDLFTAPFLANVASVVDETLYNDPDVHDEHNDAVFLATFGLLVSTALVLSGTLLWLASVFKLANLGSFLPSAVLSGFFAAVGVLTWTLAIKVDTNGVSLGKIIHSGDWDVIRNALIHHGTSVVVGVAMKILGPKHPFYVVGLIFATTAGFYIFSKFEKINESFEYCSINRLSSQILTIGRPPFVFSVGLQCLNGTHGRERMVLEQK